MICLRYGMLALLVALGVALLGRSGLAQDEKLPFPRVSPANNKNDMKPDPKNKPDPKDKDKADDKSKNKPDDKAKNKPDDKSNGNGKKELGKWHVPQPNPMLFPQTPFPPPAPPFKDPRTGAWQQVTTCSNPPGHNPAVPPLVHGQVLPPRCMGLADFCWQLRTRRASNCTILLTENGKTEEWEVVVPPQP